MLTCRDSAWRQSCASLQHRQLQMQHCIIVDCTVDRKET